MPSPQNSNKIVSAYTTLTPYLSIVQASLVPQTVCPLPAPSPKPTLPASLQAWWCITVRFALSLLNHPILNQGSLSHCLCVVSKKTAPCYFENTGHVRSMKGGQADRHGHPAFAMMSSIWNADKQVYNPDRHGDAPRGASRHSQPMSLQPLNTSKLRSSRPPCTIPSIQTTLTHA